jgi:E1A-binding protein p400
VNFYYDQEEEQRLKKVALNISKDVKKFWLKIEKLASLSSLN